MYSLPTYLLPLTFAALIGSLVSIPISPDNPGGQQQNTPQDKQPDKQPTTESLAAPVWVAGYSVTTNNADEMSSNGKIPALWTRFLQQNLAATIPNKSGQSLIVVYSDYASDDKGKYSYLLGAPVNSIDKLPTGITYKTLPAGAYAVFTTDRGPVAKVVQSTWMKIWSSTPEQMGGKRSFKADYEIYDQRSADPNNSQVEIHVGIQSPKQ